MKQKFQSLGRSLSRAQAKGLIGGNKTIEEGGSCSGGSSSDTCSSSTTCTTSCGGSSVSGHCSWSNAHSKCYCVSSC